MPAHVDMKTPNCDKRQNQHSVPQFLLRNFASNLPAKKGKEKIWAFDKRTGNTFNPNVKGVTSKSKYYEASFGEFKMSLEDGLCKLEDATAPVFQKVIRNRSLSGLNGDEWTWATMFVAAQFLRTEGHREQFIEISELIDEKLKSTDAIPSELEGWSTIDKQNAKEVSLSFLVDHLGHFTKQFAEKIWMIHEAPPGESFYIGDNPVVMHNREYHKPYGNLGLSVRGIQIYLPIDPQICLAMYHPSIIADAKLNLERARKDDEQLRFEDLIGLGRGQPGWAETRIMAGRVIQSTTELIAAAESGSPLAYSRDNVTFVNSLQIHNASRFVMSKRNNFELAAEMLRSTNHGEGRNRRWSIAT